MKVAQNDETNPNTLSVYLSHASKYLNMEPSPPVQYTEIELNAGKISQIFSRSVCDVNHCARSPLTPRSAMFCSVITFIAVYLYCFSSPFLPVRPETADDALVINYFTVEDPAFASKQPGKPPL
jgi:hypothetical protein